MSYKKSKARIEFDEAVKDLLKLSKTISYKSYPLSYNHKLLIYQSSIFILSAKIEEYTKTIIEDLIFSFKSNKATMSTIPINLRTKGLIDKQMNSYRLYMSNERKLLDQLNCNNSFYELLNGGIIFDNHFNSSTVLSGNKYPSIKNLKILYYRLGITDIFNSVAKRGKKDYKSQLESFLSVREAIAHQSTPTLTILDVSRHFENIQDFVNKVDRVLYSEITSYSGSIHWEYCT